MNRNFGKMNEGAIEYAPNNIRIGGTIYANPTAEQYATQGWLPIRDEKPSGKVGVYYIPDGWEIRPDEQTSASAIYRTYREEPIVAPPRRIRHFSKLSLYVVLTKLGITDEAFMAWLATKQVEVEGVVIRGDLAFNKAQDLTDNHPAFESIVKDAQVKFCISDEQLAEILAAIEYNPMEVA